jgi:CubicO group peptidase (beta-lactamase class C family)
MPRTSHLDRERLQDAVRIAEEAVRSGTHPSAVIAVADSRQTLWTHAVPGPDNVSLDSIFLVASITKPIVATAILQLVEQGKLQLDAPVSRYLPEFTGQGKERITTWHLLTHSSGLEEEHFWSELDSLAGTGNLPARRWLFEACCRSYTNFEPGSAYHYNSLTFNVLAELIGHLSSQPYDEYLWEHIFEPLGMEDTAFYPLDRNRAVPVTASPRRTM